MKKILAIALAACSFALISCNDTTDVTEKNSDSSHIQTSEDISYNSANNSSTTNEENTDGVTITNIYGGYNEGLMFISTENSRRPISCIDKTGKTVFTVDASYSSGFHNGLAMLYQDEVVLCDKTGKIITAEELGGDKFIDEEVIFADGYILVKKTTTSYQGSYDEMAVFNSKLEKIVDFSQELYETYERDFTYSSTNCYNGYLFNSVVDGYIDLNTGTVSKVSSELMNKIQPKRESDFWCVGERYNGSFYTENDEELFIYDGRKKWFSDEYTPTISTIFDLSEYENAYVVSMNEFFYNGYVDGYAGLRFRVEDSEEGERNYFTIMDEKGEFCFEPIETQGIITDVKSENGIFALRVTPNSFSKENFYVEVYDKSGKIGAKEYQRSKNGRIQLDYGMSDGVIYIVTPNDDGDGNKVELYTTDLQPLFKVN